MNNKPIKERPIEESKIQKLKELMYESHSNHDFLRHIFTPRKVEENNKETEFIKIGMNEILERAWLVNQEGLKTYWAYERIGSGFGRNIALFEANLIINKIIKLENECEGGIVTKKLTQDSLKDSFEEFKSINADTIITNVKSNHYFYEMNDFEPINDGKIPFFQGKIFGMNVYWFSSVPENKTIILNSKNFAEILEKKEINLEIFEKLDREKAIKALPKLESKDLDEYISILVYEIIGFKIKDPKSLLILEHK